jgi:hypothetical protein
MKRIVLPVLLALTSIAVATSPARADHQMQVRYVGVHPIPKEYGGGTCYIEVPHVHVYMVPDAKLHYRNHRGSLYFVGDPVAYGYDGPKYAYNGPHPIRVDAVADDDDDQGDPDEEYCYIQGPHYHNYAPPPVIAAQFKLDGGAYWWVAPPPRAYLDARPVYAKVNTYYTPLRYERPTVVVDAPPPGWIGARVDVVPPAAVVDVQGPVVGAAVVEPGVVVGGGVEAHVGVALPSVDVQIGGPAVVVGAPPPGVIVVEKRRHYHDDDDDQGWHHDNGRHRGWGSRDHRR